MPIDKKRHTRVWQRMLSGRCLDLRQPKAKDISLQDIAHGLSRLARWNGQTAGKHAFSVAQHSVLVRDIALYYNPQLDAMTQLYILLHDAPEYVIGDLISPFKKLIGDDYRSYEEAIAEAIHSHFDLKHPVDVNIASLIKHADQTAAFVEAIGIAGFSIAEAKELFLDNSPDYLILKQDFATIVPLAVYDSETLFLQECHYMITHNNTTREKR